MFEGTKLLDAVGVARYLGIGRTTLFAMKKDPAFPAPVRLYEGQKKLLWDPASIDRFVAMKAKKAS